MSLWVDAHHELIRWAFIARVDGEETFVLFKNVDVNRADFAIYSSRCNEMVRACVRRFPGRVMEITYDSMEL